MTQQPAIHRYFFLACTLIAGVLAFLIVRPLIQPIVGGMLLAFICMPVYKFLLKYIKNKTGTALLVSLLVIVILAVPFIFAIQNSIQDAQYIYLRSRQILNTGDILNIGCNADDTQALCRLVAPLQNLIQDPDVRLQLQNAIAKSVTVVINVVTDTIVRIPQIALQAFVMFFSVFYFLKDGDAFLERFKAVVPMKEAHKAHIAKKMREVMSATIYGTLLIALIQGICAWIGYMIFGISSPLLLGILTAFFALLPVLGTAVVWVPAGLFLILSGATTGDASVWSGIGLLIYGTLIIGGIDNIVRPKLIGTKAQVHPMIVLLGAIGGLVVFGFVGFFIGPIILALVTTLISIYENDKSILEQY